MEVTKFNNNGDVIDWDGYSYVIKYKKLTETTWRCSKENCPGTMYTDNPRIGNDHNHKAEKHEIKRDIVLDNDHSGIDFDKTTSTCYDPSTITSILSANNSTPSTTTIPSSSTVTLLKRKHSTISSCLPVKMACDKKSRLDNALLNMFIIDLQPFKVVESKCFKQLINELYQNYPLPTRQEISETLIPLKYQECVSRVKDLIQMEADYVCLTIDYWVPMIIRTTLSYIAVTVHFVNKQFILRSVLLECSKMTTNTISEKYIERMIVQWQLKEKIILAVIVSGNFTIENVRNLNVIYCKAGFNNTLVMQSLEKCEPDLTKKVKNIIAHIQTLKSNNITEKYCFENELKLIRTVNTNWNRVFCMEWMVSLEKSLQTILASNALTDHELKTADWSIIKELRRVLEPFQFQCVTNENSAELYITASMYFPFIKSLSELFTEMKNKTFDPRIHTIINVLYAKIRRWEEMNNDSIPLAKCTFLDPRFKNILFPWSNKIQSEVTKELVIELSQKENLNEINDNNYDAEPSEEHSTNNHCEQFSIWNNLNNQICKSRPGNKHQSVSQLRATSEIKDYLDVPNINLKQDPFKWWRKNASHFPGLFSLARQILCCQATTVPCQRFFSKVELIFNDPSSHLNTNEAVQKIFLNKNLEIVNML